MTERSQRPSLQMAHRPISIVNHRLSPTLLAQQTSTQDLLLNVLISLPFVSDVFGLPSHTQDGRDYPHCWILWVRGWIGHGSELQTRALRERKCQWNSSH